MDKIVRDGGCSVVVVQQSEEWRLKPGAPGFKSCWPVGFSLSSPDYSKWVFNPLNPRVHFLLHHTVHCVEKIVSACLRAGSASAERVGQGRWVGSPIGCCAHGGC